MAKKKDAAPAAEAKAPAAKGKKAAPAAKGKGVAAKGAKGAKVKGVVKSITKKQLMEQLVAKSGGLTKVQVQGLYDALVGLITDNLSSKGPKTLTLPGLGKLVSVAKPADPGGKDVRNPFTGATVKSKPRDASMQVRFRPSKTFKGGLGS